MDAERVDLASIPPDEWDENSVFRRGYIDLTVSWISDDDSPEDWTCLRCGGTDFEGVDRDHMPAGIQGASYSLEPLDDEQST